MKEKDILSGSQYPQINIFLTQIRNLSHHRQPTNQLTGTSTCETGPRHQTNRLCLFTSSTYRNLIRLFSPARMGRGKVILKRIEDKSNRQVSFSKRRNGFLKKSHELAVLCDVDVAAFVFSGTGRLHEFSTRESMTNILTRYQSFKKTEELVRASVHEKPTSDVCTADELTEMIQRHLEENNIKLIDMTGLEQLEQQLGSFIQQIRIRKTQLNMDILKALQDKELQLKKERNRMMQEIEAARTNGINGESSDAEPPRLAVMNV